MQHNREDVEGEPAGPLLGDCVRHPVPAGAYFHVKPRLNITYIGQMTDPLVQYLDLPDRADVFMVSTI